MKIITTRRISQVFFLVLFLWFCVVATYGAKFWQLRAWPINWFLQLDPLTAIGTILTTHKLYWPLLWSLAVVVLTIFLGRFFCGWLCPLGSMQHFASWLSCRGKSSAELLAANKYRKAQRLKYFILVAVLAAAAMPYPRAALFSGLFDPIPLVYRSVNVGLLAVMDNFGNIVSATDRVYPGGWLIVAVLLGILAMCSVVPRFYCRFICPLGAMLGLMSEFALWRIGKSQNKCSNCRACEKHCQGGCTPAGKIHTAECILCFNCRSDCKDELVGYRTSPSEAGEHKADIGRRGFIFSAVAGTLAVPVLALGRGSGGVNDKIVRPPGSLSEAEFLKRCIKCGQCMRICPSNVIAPGRISDGLDVLWTPVLNNRTGSSGCQLNCTACGYVCPTAAIRPITLSEKLGLNEYAENGPVKIGLAAVNRWRCLPWAFGKPCIVCQENCPVSPKAIYTRACYEDVRDGVFDVIKTGRDYVTIADGMLKAEEFASGDYYCLSGVSRLKILSNSRDTIFVASDKMWQSPVQTVRIQVRLLQPYVDADKCIGCGICQHECPVSDPGAIEIFADGQSRRAQNTIITRSYTLKGNKFPR